MRTMLPLNDVDNQHLALIEERAAFVGSFDPMDLAASLSTPLSTPVLEVLSGRCDELARGDRFEWSLKPDSRNDVFKRLTQSDRLQSVAADARKSGVDALGQWIVDLVLEYPTSLKELSRSDMDALRVAKELVGPFLKNIQLPDIDSAVERRAAEDALSVVRSPSLIGRAIELKVLSEFLDAPSRSGRPLTITVTGMGGSGKSALLAQFVHQTRGPDWAGPFLVLFDFDRALFCKVESTAMMAELARQIGLYLPNSKEIAEFRRHAENTSPLSAGQRYYEKNASTSTTVASLWRKYVLPHIPPGVPVVIILDTFEEIVLRGDSEMHLIDRWLGELQSEYALASVKVIFSGRALPILPHAFSEPYRTPLELGDLPSEDASALLKRNIPENLRLTFPAENIVAKFGGNALVLKILARIVTAEGASAALGLLNENYRPSHDSQLAQGFLYTRILRRLRSDNPSLQKLAHPGLVLRRVTPQLIQGVLAEPCGLDKVSDPEALTLFEELAKQVWLVEKESDEVLLHRKDLRRLMLQLLERELVEPAEKIHRRAAEYYETHQDPRLDATSSAIEGAYHRLFLGELPELSKDQARALLHSVGADIACVPARARTLLKFAADYALTPGEMNQLSVADQRLYVNASSHRGYDAGIEPDEAQQGLRGAAASLPPALRPINSFAVLKAFTEGDFGWLASVSKDVVQMTFRDQRGESRNREERDLVNSAIWQTALASMAAGTGCDLADFIQSQRHYKNADQVAFDKWIPNVRNSISYWRAIDTVVKFLNPAAKLPDRRSASAGNENMNSQIRTTDQLRAFQMLGPGEKDAGKKVSISMQLIRCMDCELLRFAADGHEPDPLRQNSERWRTAVATILPVDGRKLTLADVGERVATLPAIETDSANIALNARVLMFGTLPEMYPAIRGALRATPDEALLAFVELAASIANGWPAELYPDQFARSLGREREKWTSTLIESADRYGILSLLVGEIIDKNSAEGSISLSNILHELRRRLAFSVN
jgi:hypothetical protein